MCATIAVIICPLGLHWINDLPVSKNTSWQPSVDNFILGHLQGSRTVLPREAFRILGAARKSSCARRKSGRTAKAVYSHGGRPAEQFPALKAPGGELHAGRQQSAASLLWHTVADSIMTRGGRIDVALMPVEEVPDRVPQESLQQFARSEVCSHTASRQVKAAGRGRLKATHRVHVGRQHSLVGVSSEM